METRYERRVRPATDKRHAQAEGVAAQAISVRSTVPLRDPVAQLVEQRTFNPQAAGSIPARVILLILPRDRPLLVQTPA